MTDKRRVLIVCTGNSARSQIAEGLLRHDKGEHFEVESAGTKPGKVRPEAIAVMKELGIDISVHRSKSVDEFAGEKFDYVLTVRDNAKETCPIFPGHANRLHQNFEDPAVAQVPKWREWAHSAGSVIRFERTCAVFRRSLNGALRGGRVRPGRVPRNIPQVCRRSRRRARCARHAASRDLRCRAGAYREFGFSGRC